MSERKLVTIRTIAELLPIEGADNIEVARVDGWKVVVKKGEFEVGDKCVFYEIDSFLPANAPQYEFLRKNGIKNAPDGCERIRLKTVKLRGQLSQGLALPIGAFPENQIAFWDADRTGNALDSVLNVTKYDPDDGCWTLMAAKSAGRFPEFIPRTDEERIQNIYAEYAQKYKNVEFRPSIKLDGCSITIAAIKEKERFIDVKKLNDGNIPYPYAWPDMQIIVCLRNLILKHDPTSAFWKAVERKNENGKSLIDCLRTCRYGEVWQGELMGPGIQGNKEKLLQNEVFIFRIFDPDLQVFWDDGVFQFEMEISKEYGVKPVPQLPICKPFADYATLDELLAASNIPSMNAPVAEGIVYKSVEKIDGETIHFKVINNQFLLNEGRS